MLLVNLKPGALYRLIGMPFAELNNTFIDAEDILPKEIRQVNERLSSAESPQEMIDIVEKLLLGLTLTRFAMKAKNMRSGCKEPGFRSGAIAFQDRSIVC